MPDSVSPYHSRHLQPITVLKGVGPKTAGCLARKDVASVEDLLHCLPLRYDDRRNFVPIAKLIDGERATVCGELTRLSHVGGRGRNRRTLARLTDDTGEIEVVWFGFGGQDFARGDRVVLTGRVGMFEDRHQLRDPEGEVFTGEPPRCIVPVYSETEGMRQRAWRRVIDTALTEAAEGLVGAVPPELLAAERLQPPQDALRSLHQPDGAKAEPDQLTDPHLGPLRSLVFEELFVFQLGLALRRRALATASGTSLRVDAEVIAPLIDALPFSLTPGQQAVWDAVAADLRADRPMHRLVHGDVGSGKTVLAALAAFAAVKNGYQAAIMVPTEVLAEQHARRLEQWLTPLGVKVALATGSLTGRRRARMRDRLALGVEQIVVGTHALISGDLEFHRLGLVVIDEQHKFGVNQRANLISKGPDPDVLVLTATPIPRSLALTLYGDLDVSLLRDRPGGKAEVSTRVCLGAERDWVYADVAEKLRLGRQAYIVCPRLDVIDDETIDVQSLYDELAAGPLARFRLAMLHGRMKTDARLAIVDDFAAGRIDALVATSVIEVGLDVPGAGVLVVENAERFGLAQLHQMRGRIGRDGQPGWCFLLTRDELSETAIHRLSFLTECADGFAIAETDLRLRGPGELLGARQSGLPPLRYAKEALADLALLERTRDAAAETLATDPTLGQPGNQWARMVVLQRWGALLGEGRFG